MKNERIPNVTVENATIFWRNFAGKEAKFNAAGSRNFCLLLDAPNAELMSEQGWNIKWTKPRDPDDDPQPYVQVKVVFGDYPPAIWMITGNKKTKLDEDSVSILDYAEIENVDLIITPYVWDISGKTGVTAYLKTMYITIHQNEFEKKYGDLSMDDDDLPFNM